MASYRIGDVVAGLSLLLVGGCLLTKAQAQSGPSATVSVTSDGSVVLFAGPAPEAHRKCSEGACASGYHFQACAGDGGTTTICEKDADPCETQQPVLEDGGPLKRYWRHADGGIFSEDESPRRVCPSGLWLWPPPPSIPRAEGRATRSTTNLSLALYGVENALNPENAAHFARADARRKGRR